MVKKFADYGKGMVTFMRYISDDDKLCLKNTVVTLGKFDGLHLGHRLLIDIAKKNKEANMTTVLFSFQLHPYNLLQEKEFEQIYTEEEKRVKLEESGIDVFVSYPFTETTREMSPEEFVAEVLVKKLDAKIIVVGSDYHFGCNRRGDVALLQTLSKQYGYELVVCEKLMTSEHQVISSTYIREELMQGNMELVNKLLGQTFSIIGEVVHGRQLGRTFGIPTINQVPPGNKLLPPNGVYASTTFIDGVSYQGVTNIGYKPTVGGEKLRGVETFLFDFDGDLYGRTLEVCLHTYTRKEQKFPSLEVLKATMEQDIVHAKEYFAKI